jgi:hypothetical protein
MVTKTQFKTMALLGTAVLAAAVSLPSRAGRVDVTVQGREAIFLAGRHDVVIPPLGSGLPFPLARHDFVLPDFVREAFPTGMVVRSLGQVQVGSPASGGIDFFNSPSATFFPPEGDVSSTSRLDGLGGISGYVGPAGALVGVFLNNSNPAFSVRPPTLDFSTPANRDFFTLRPALRQVFFVGNGFTSGGVAQRFVAPTGASRFYLGIADGAGFVGAPGFYEDNNGFYFIRLNIVP